jgi:hypothetical protein
LNCARDTPQCGFFGTPFLGLIFLTLTYRTSYMSAYQEFERHFLHPDWEDFREGCPLELLDALDTEERLAAENELLQQISGSLDWPIRGLGKLRSAAALPRLRELLDQTPAAASPRTTVGRALNWLRPLLPFDPRNKAARSYARRAVIALAIWHISRDDTMCDVIVQVSIDCNTWYSGNPKSIAMHEIINCLAQLPHRAALRRLIQLGYCPNADIVSSVHAARRWFPRPDEEVVSKV